MIGEPKTIEPRLGDEIPNDWLVQAEQEIKAKFRLVTLPEFRGLKDVEVHVWQPNTGEDSQTATVYTKAYTKLLKDPDTLTRSQMRKILEERGIWGEQQEKEVEALRDEQKNIEFEVATLRSKNKNPNQATLSRLRAKWNEVKSKIQEKLVEKENYLSNTVEGRAEEEQLKAKLSLCVKFTDGTRLWPTMQDLDKETDRSSVVSIMNAAILFWMGLTQEIIDVLPAQIIFGGEKSEN